MSFILGMMVGGFLATILMCIFFVSKESNSRE